MAGFGDCVADGLLVKTVDKAAAFAHQCGFLFGVLLEGAEAFGMLGVDVGDYSNLGADDGAKCLHFALARHSGFDDGEFGAFGDFPHRQGHAYLRVEAAG